MYIKIKTLDLKQPWVIVVDDSLEIEIAPAAAVSAAKLNSSKRQWFNNGEKNIFTTAQPAGFTPGMLKKITTQMSKEK